MGARLRQFPYFFYTAWADSGAEVRLRNAANSQRSQARPDRRASPFSLGLPQGENGRASAHHSPPTIPSLSRSLRFSALYAADAHSDEAERYFRSDRERRFDFIVSVGSDVMVSTIGAKRRWRMDL